MTRILHVIHSVDPRSGGPSHALRELVREQGRAGHRPEVLATSVQSAEPWAPADEYSASMTADPAFLGAPVTLLPAWGRRRPWSRWAHTPAARRWMRRLFADRARRPDVIHIHGTFSHLTAVAATEGRRAGVPYVLRPAGSFNALCLEQGSSRVKALLIRGILRRQLREAAALHAMSDEEARQLAPFAGSTPIRVIPHGIDVASDDAGNDGPHAAEWARGGDRKWMLFLSRLHAKKRPQLLVDVLAALLPAAPELGLLLAGSDAGELPAVLARAQQLGVADRVVVAGFLEGAAKAAAYRAASVFVLPSIDENFGVAVVEAMGHGVPVVVTPGVAAHVYVDASGSGLTVDGSLGPLTGAVRTILESNREEWGERGREFVARCLSWPAVSARIDEMYAAAMQRLTV